MGVKNIIYINYLHTNDDENEDYIYYILTIISHFTVAVIFVLCIVI